MECLLHLEGGLLVLSESNQISDALAATSFVVASVLAFKEVSHDQYIICLLNY